MLTHTTLEQLKDAIRAVAGEGPASEILFRVGRMTGRSWAEALDPSLSVEEGFERGVRELGELGIADLRPEGLVQDGDDLRLRAAVCLHEQPVARPAGPQASATCGMVAGYVTGILAGLSGLDLVCDWLRVPGQEGSCGGEACCSFEVRPAHLGPPRAPGGDRQPKAPQPMGAARFFLGSVGGSLGAEAISLSSFFESTSDAVVMLDLSGIVRYWNSGAERMFGWGRDELVGQAFERIVPDDLREDGEVDWIQRQVTAHGSLDNHLTRRLTRAGEVRWVSLTRTQLVGASGRLLGSMGVLRDLTEYRRTEEALGQARHLASIGEMAATVAHDIKNPLAAIHAALQYIGRDEIAAEERREVLDEVSNEVYRVDETIQDLLRFARRVPPRRERVVVRRLVDTVIAELHLALDLAEHGHAFEIDEQLEASLDVGIVSRVLRNLLVNASQSMQGPGTITVVARLEGEELWIDVRDTGVGIDEDVLETLFEPFVTTKARGTGLGLPIARRYAEGHGGRLELVETGPDGTCFRIALPLGR